MEMASLASPEDASEGFAQVEGASRKPGREHNTLLTPDTNEHGGLEERFAVDSEVWTHEWASTVVPMEPQARKDHRRETDRPDTNGFRARAGPSNS